MSRRPVLFLDVDGVLNCRASFKNPVAGYKPLDADKITLLNRIAAETNCLVVVSSTWRLDAGFKERLAAVGAKIEYHDEWRTEYMHATTVNGIMIGKRRGDEIKQWLVKNGRGDAPFVILDDDSDMLDEQRPHFVHTTFEKGLTKAHADVAIALLRGE